MLCGERPGAPYTGPSMAVWREFDPPPRACHEKPSHLKIKCLAQSNFNLNQKKGCASRKRAPNQRGQTLTRHPRGFWDPSSLPPVTPTPPPQPSANGGVWKGVCILFIQSSQFRVWVLGLVFNNSSWTAVGLPSLDDGPPHLTLMTNPGFLVFIPGW